ncbi:DUF6368 family protein [Inquilinus sp. CA228]|uniref:DUF6368 family protein n=1 Tax=Inquilinus sp. CA228 TaxID=3455609 RepID=UPI003F8D2041
MAGPVLEILLWQSVSGDRARLLHDLVAAVTGSVDEDLLHVVTTRPLGGSYDGNPSLPFLIVSGLDEASPDPAGIEAAFGRVPRDSIALCAMTNGSDARRVLAELSLAIAERLDGVVAFNGLLLPNRGVDVDGTLDEVLPVAAEYLAGLPGKVAVIPYENVYGGKWGSHVGDATFLRAWLNHPDFYLIK